MYVTDTDYTGWKNGKCWWLAIKFAGSGADKRNAKTVSEMVSKGYEVREMPVSDAVEAHLAAIP